MIYFDNAATSGVKPKSVINSVNSALKYYSANPGRSGYKTSIDAAIKIYEARTNIADFFGAEAENVAFTLNCTHALNCILKGVLKKGDHIIVSDLEHNAVMRPLFKLSKVRGVEYSTAQVSIDDEITVKNFENLIKSNTKMILCTHASNVTGQILPIKKIGEICNRYGLLFGVDAAQSAGVLPINMKEMNIDYLSVAAHKGLYAPMGIGILISRKPLENTVLEGGTGTNSIDLSQPEDLPERIESGTVNLPGIFGVLSGLKFVKQNNPIRLYKNELSIIRYIYSAFKNIEKIKLYTPSPQLFKSVPVLPFNIKGKSSDEVAKYLAQNNIATRAGLHCAPSAHKKLGTIPDGCVRLSTGFFNTFSQADYLIKIIKNL